MPLHRGSWSPVAACPMMTEIVCNIGDLHGAIVFGDHHITIKVQWCTRKHIEGPLRDTLPRSVPVPLWKVFQAIPLLTNLRYCLPHPMGKGPYAFVSKTYLLCYVSYVLGSIILTCPPFFSFPSKAQVQAIAEKCSH